MSLWQLIGRMVAPAKRAAFWLGARVYKTTRPRVAIMCQGEILLVQNWGDKHWSLPGGGAHRGEDLAVAAAREVREELGIELDSKLLHYSETFEFPTYYAPLFTIELPQKPLVTRQKIEIYRVEWFPHGQIPRDTQLLQKLRF